MASPRSDQNYINFFKMENFIFDSRI